MRLQSYHLQKANAVTYVTKRTHERGQKELLVRCTGVLD